MAHLDRGNFLGRGEGVPERWYLPRAQATPREQGRVLAMGGEWCCRAAWRRPRCSKQWGREHDAGDSRFAKKAARW